MNDKKENPNNNACTPVSFSTIKVSLEGPFAVVLEKASDNANHVQRVRAFVPVDNMGMTGSAASGSPMLQHEFWAYDPAPDINKNKKMGTDDGSTHFQLELKTTNDRGGDGLECCTATRLIEPGFQHFNFATDAWDKRETGQYGENFVAITLPCPDRILFCRKASSVVFDTGQSGYMPLHHVLEYKVAQPNFGFCFTMTNNGKDPSVIPLPGDSNTFLLQVGLHGGTEPSDAKAHAIHFYNEVLLSRFPKLADQTLRHIFPPPPESPGNQIKALALDVECHQGGGIVSFPS